jgi:hypothetical protein
VDPALVRPADPSASIDPTSPSLVELIAVEGWLDAELAALLWLLLDARVPLVVAGHGDPADRQRLLDALLDLLPAEVRRQQVAGAVLAPWDPRTTCLVLETLDLDDAPTRTALRSLERGFGLATTLTADSLEEVFAQLGAPPLSLDGDVIRQLGVVLVLGGAPLRVVAAHYLRPVERDGQGHLQRRPPAVLATWDPALGHFEHFAWGVTPELANRAGMTQADFERRQQRRGRFLDQLARTRPDALFTAALRDFRAGEDIAAAAVAPLPAHDHQHRH